MTVRGNQGSLPVFLYDCFAETRFGGNVGAFVLDATDLATDDMQAIAREVNAPVTGFVTGLEGNRIACRFFMPTAEIAMCGHVTVGLFTHIHAANPEGPVEFVLSVPAGEIPVTVESTREGRARVMMALSPPRLLDIEVDRTALARALRVDTALLETKAQLAGADAGLKHLFVHLPDGDRLAALRPDFQSLKEISEASGVHTVACFAMTPGANDHDLAIRDFCPAVGVPEVPASGTTNGALTGHLVAHGFIPARAQRLCAAQGAEIGRPSRITYEIEVTGQDVTDLRVGGTAVPSLSGHLAPLASRAVG